MASHGVTRTIRTRTEEQRRQDLEKIEKYRELETQIRHQTNQQNYADPALFQLTTQLLRLNPEYYTIWNVRRRCLISGSLCRRSDGSWPSKASPSSSASDTTKPSSGSYLPSSSASTPSDQRSQQVAKDGRSGTLVDDGVQNSTKHNDTREEAEEDEYSKEQMAKDSEVLQSELAFTIPLLLEFPKCYWIWNFRSWLLEQAIIHLPTPVSRQIWEAELALTAKMLVKDRRNFHAWSYRRQIVSKLESSVLDGLSMAEAEFAYTTKMVRADLSNFSAWHNRSRLILRVLDERGAGDQARKAFLEEELALARDGLNVGPEDQSLWYYHQFLVSHITDYVDRPTIAFGLTVEERRAYIEREIEDVKDLLEDYDDVKWIYEVLLEYTLALDSIEGGGEKSDVSQATKNDMMNWLAKLKKLDPMRNGRWNDAEKILEER